MTIFEYVTLFLISTFYGAYFYKQVLLKKHHVKTHRLLKGTKPKHTFYIELWLVISAFLIPVLQYGNIFFPKHLHVWTQFSALKLIGIFMLAIGLLYFIVAIIFMKDNWRAGIDESQETKLVTNGIYSKCRNPAFVGFGLMYVGCVVVTPNWILIIISIIAIVGLHFQVLQEEKFLSKKFGQTYLLYKHTTPRYF